MSAAVPSLLHLDTMPHNQRVAPPVGIRGPASRVALQIVLVHIRASDDIHFTGPRFTRSIATNTGAIKWFFRSA